MSTQRTRRLLSDRFATGAARDRDAGFTLIELMVVIVVIGILSAIAIPMFLNARIRGQVAATQSLLRALGTQAMSGIIAGEQPDAINNAVAAEASRWRVGGNPVVVSPNAGAASTDDAHVATTLEVADGQTTWVASVLASDQSCMRVAASSEHGMSSVSPVSGRDACTPVPGAEVAAQEPAGPRPVTLTAAEFAAGLVNPYNNRPGRPVVWTNGSVRLPENGVLLSGGSSPALSDLTLSASVHADASTGATGAGLVFRGSQGTNGLTGYVFQVDPGYLTNGQPSILLRQWTNGSETGVPGRVVVPTGIDPRGTNQLKVQVVGNQFVGYVNGTEVMRVNLPPNGPTGTQYGARSWGSGCGPNARLSCGADISGLTVTPTQ